jgi:hypothetical protein
MVKKQEHTITISISRHTCLINSRMLRLFLWQIKFAFKCIKFTPYYVYENGDAHHLTTEQYFVTEHISMAYIYSLAASDQFLPSHSSDNTSYEGMGKVLWLMSEMFHIKIFIKEQESHWHQRFNFKIWFWVRKFDYRFPVLSLKCLYYSL